MESKKQVIYKDGRWIQLASGETDAIELNLNDGSWKMETNPNDSIIYTKTCSDEEIASLSVNNVRLTGTVRLKFLLGKMDINTSTFGVFNLMHINESINGWSRKTFSSVFEDLTVVITAYSNYLLVIFSNKSEYNRESLGVDFTPVKTTAEHYYKIYINDTAYIGNVSDIDSVQFRYPIDNNQELVFPVIQKPGSDAIKNVVSTVYNGHIYEIHFSKDNPLSPGPTPTDKDNKLIIRHMDGTVDNDAVGEGMITGSVELRGHTLFIN